MESNGESPFDGVVKLMESAEGAFDGDGLEKLVSEAIFEAVKVDIQRREAVKPSGALFDEYAGEVCVTFRFSREVFADHLERVLNEALKITEKEHD